MASKDKGISRLEAAKLALKRDIERLPDSAEVMIYTLNSNLQQIYSGGKNGVDRVIDGIRQSSYPSRTELINNLIHKGKLVLYYDCTYKVAKGIYSRCFKMGKSNWAITDMEARKEVIRSESDVMVRVKNLGPNKGKAVLDIKTNKGEHITIPIRLEKDEERLILKKVRHGDYILARLDVKDDNRLDNQACAKVNTGELRVGYIGKRNFYLLTGLSLFDNLKVRFLKALTSKEVKGLDLVIVNSFEFKKLPAGPRYLIFGAKAGEEMKNVQVDMYSDPVTPFLSFRAGDINIDVAYPQEKEGPYDSFLLRDHRGRGLIVMHNIPPDLRVDVNFSLEGSDFGLRYGFVVFLKGVIDWASGGRGGWIPTPVSGIDTQLEPGSCRDKGARPASVESVIRASERENPAPYERQKRSYFTVLILLGLLSGWLYFSRGGRR